MSGRAAGSSSATGSGAARPSAGDAFLFSIAATGFTVAFLHAAIPTHWLPFVVAARAQWDAGRTIAVTAIAGFGHVLFTSVLRRAGWRRTMWFEDGLQSAAVKRFLFIALLLLLPLQHSWAAVGAYCAHENTEGAESHFGHHVHKHENAGQDGGQASGAHPDCAFCHLGCGTAAPDLPLVMPEVAAASVIALNPALFRTNVPSRPERPKWLAFA